MATKTHTTQQITAHSPMKQTYFHGTKADLNIGDLIEIGNIQLWKR